MSGSTALNKLCQTIRKDGFITAVRAVSKHTRHIAADLADGIPGHYRTRHALLERHYEPKEITPIWVSPSEITTLTGTYERRKEGHLDYVPHFKPREASWDSLPFERELSYGSTVDGGWDKSREPFSKLLMYRGIRQHYVDEQPWPETIYFSQLTERFCDQGMEEDTAEKLAMDLCRDIETVYEAISNHGYRSQRALNGHPLHEVTVNVARDGTLLYNCEGRHRLSIAKILGIEKIPVLVLARHTEYDPQHTTETHS